MSDLISRINPISRNMLLTKGIHVFEVMNKTNEIAPHTLIGVAVLWQNDSAREKETFYQIPMGLAHEASVIVVAQNDGWMIRKNRFGGRGILIPTWEKVLEQFDPDKAIQV